jgi:hypothetical protein
MKHTNDIIRMAHEAGFYDGEIGRAEDAFERFAALVADRCAEIADQAEPYQAADLIRKEFAVDPMPLFDDWPGGWKK